MCILSVCARKIKNHNGWKLATVWGIGYKFEVKVTDRGNHIEEALYEKYIVFKIYHHIYDFRVHEFVHSSNAYKNIDRRTS